MTRSTPVQRLRARATAAAVAAAVVVAGLAGLAPAAEQANATVPGQPGTAQPGTTVYSENFENGTGTVAESYSAAGSTTYVGTTPTGQTYTGSPSWINGVRCNGVILSDNTTTVPAWALTTAAQPNECNEVAGVQSWEHLRLLALAMGNQFGGGANNHVDSSYTECQNTTSGDGTCDTIPSGATNGVMFKTSKLVPVAANHFYLFSVDTAYINCGTAGGDPSYQFALLNSAGTATTLGSPLDGCTTTNSPTVTTSTQTIQSSSVGLSSSFPSSYTVNLAAMATNQAVLYPSSGLGVEMYNNNGATLGNDGAFDNVNVVDVTPQLDKSFSPATIGQGQTSTLTYTVTNTSELDAKDGWAFTDNLPAGVTATGVNSTTCSTGTITAAAGATTVAIANGDLKQGQTSCTISVQVTAAAVGSYTNGPANFPATGGLTGVNPPGSATLTVIPTVNLSIVKTANAATYNPGDAITFTIKVSNAGPSTATNAAVTDPIPAQVTGATWACSASTGSACGTASGSGSISTTATIATGGTITYTVTGTVASTTTAGTTVANTATAVPPTGTSDPNCPPSPGTGCSSTATATTNQSVQVNKTWIIKNAAGTVLGTYNIPSQGTDTGPTLPGGFAATPTLTGQTSPVFGTAYKGYSVGQNVSVGEGSVTVPSGCTVASQKMTAVNGTALPTAAALPYAGTLTTTPTPDTFTITNTITCTQTLTLAKQVAYGSLPATDWTLTGTGPSGSLAGPAGVTGAAGATNVNVTPQVPYTLTEASAATGAQNYVPTAAGWTCLAGASTVPVTNSAVTVGYGETVICTITNTTAKITILKHIQDPSDGLTAGEFNLTLTPPSGLGASSTITGSETATTADTFEAKPGAAYTLTEQSLSSSTAYLALGLQQSTDGGITWTTITGNQITPTAGTTIEYRFVNESVPAIALPLTGGLGTDVITYWALGLLASAAALIAAQLYRRSRARRS